jgi:CHAD domain-containing protein
MAAQPPSTRAPRAVIATTLPIAAAVRQTLAVALAAMTSYEAAAIAGEIEPLHQMRVAARRLRAIVQLFAGAIHGSRVRIYKRDLPWLGHAAGAVRECDVIEALIHECGARLDPALALALTPLGEALAAQRNVALARFVAELRSRRYARMCQRLADPLLRRALPANSAGCAAAPAMVAPIAKSVRKAGKRIARGAAPELFHRLRVRIKRLRYALELLAGMGGKRSRKALLRLEEMQELLGVHQDVVATIAWLRAYARASGGVAPETLMAVGAMLQGLVTRREKLAARACRRWRKIVRSGLLDDALDEISRAAEAQLEAEGQREAERAPIDAPDDPPAGDPVVDRAGLSQPLRSGEAPLLPDGKPPMQPGAAAPVAPDPGTAVAADSPPVPLVTTVPTNG